MRLAIGTILALCLAGCSMRWWGGKTADETPGVHVHGGSLLEPPGIDVTSDCDAVLDGFDCHGPTTTQPFAIKFDHAQFGQKPSVDLPLIPEILGKLPEIQRTQVEYAKVWADVITDLIDTAGAVINVMSALKVHQTSTGLQVTLPGGLTIGGQKVTTPGQINDYLQSITAQLQALKAKPPLSVAEKPAASQP